MPHPSRQHGGAGWVPTVGTKGVTFLGRRAERLGRAAMTGAVHGIGRAGAGEEESGGPGSLGRSDAPKAFQPVGAWSIVVIYGVIIPKMNPASIR